MSAAGTSPNASSATPLADLRHDLRNPVGNVIGYAEMLIEEATQSGRADLAGDLEKIHEAGKRLLSLIDARLSDAAFAGLMPPPSVLQPRSVTEPCPSTPAGRTVAAAGIAHRPTAQAGESADEAPGCLLVVDDVAENRELLARRLAQQGHAVTSAAGGVEALDCLACAHFDVVLLDIMMPDLGGYEVLARIKANERLRHIPVIMISALDEIDSVVRCIEMGAADYLPKPFNPTLLKARIAACLREKRAHDREQKLFQELQTNYHRLQEAEARLQAAYAREKHIAEALQYPLTRPVAEDAFPGFRIATLYEAALAEAQVGGDFFDAFALPGGRVALAVADASGKGLAAAARTLQVKDVLRALAREQYEQHDSSPEDAAARVVARLNRFVCGTHDFEDQAGEGFVCLALAVLDRAAGHGSIVLAGCEPPLVVRADRESAEMIETFGLPLGIEPSAEYVAAPLRLAPGDTLLMMTDGLTEARPGRRSEMLGCEGVAALAWAGLRATDSSLRAAGETILEGARAHAGGSLHDDACLLLVRRETGTPTP